MADEAAQAAAAAVINDMFGEGDSLPPVSNDPGAVVAHEVGDLVADYQGPTTTGWDGWRNDRDELAIYERARQLLRPTNSPAARRAALFPGEKLATVEQPQPSQRSPQAAPARSADELVEGLDESQFARFEEAMYARQSRDFRVDEAVAEPLEEVFQGVDEWTHQLQVDEARAEGYASGWQSGVDEIQRASGDQE